MMMKRSLLRLLHVHSEAFNLKGTKWNGRYVNLLRIKFSSSLLDYVLPAEAFKKILRQLKNKEGSFPNLVHVAKKGEAIPREVIHLDERDNSFHLDLQLQHPSIRSLNQP